MSSSQGDLDMGASPKNRGPFLGVYRGYIELYRDIQGVGFPN